MGHGGHALLQLRAAWTVPVLSRVPMEVTGPGQLLFLTVVALSWGFHHGEKAETQAQGGCDWGPHTLPLVRPQALWVLGGCGLFTWAGLPWGLGWFLGFTSPRQPHPASPPSSSLQLQALSVKRQGRGPGVCIKHSIYYQTASLRACTLVSDSGQQPLPWPEQVLAGSVRWGQAADTDGPPALWSPLSLR